MDECQRAGLTGATRETQVTYLSGPFVQARLVYRKAAAQAEFEVTASLARASILAVITIAIIAGVIGHSVLATAGMFFTLLGVITAVDFAVNAIRRSRARRGHRGLREES